MNPFKGRSVPRGLSSCRIGVYSVHPRIKTRHAEMMKYKGNDGAGNIAHKRIIIAHDKQLVLTTCSLKIDPRLKSADTLTLSRVYVLESA